uniref:Uncharacterized protein n=1 Tax=Anopheles christyi TaxID=43041 RepID=A0A182KAG1_9DIPT
MAYTSVCAMVLMVVAITTPVHSGRSVFLGRERPRTLQMIGSANPRMLHKISADLQPDTSKVVHIQVPYYVERPKHRPKKFQPWIPRNQRFVSSSGPHLLQQQQHHSGPPVSFGTPFPAREAPFKVKPILPNEFLANPGPYDTPFVPVMKPSPVNPLHVEPPAPEIMFEPISILPLEAPSFDTIRNHVNFLKQRQQAFFEEQGREFGLAGGGIGTVPDELEYFGEHEKRLGDGSVHNGEPDRDQGGERNTLSEHDFGQNDRKYDRRGKSYGVKVEEEDGEEDFYDSEGKQYQDDDFEDSREQADRVAAFEPKKVYTQVRHREVVRHVPREETDEEENGEDEDENEGRDHEERNDKEDPKQADDEEADEDEDEEHQERHSRRLPIRERVNLQRKNIVYSEKGRQDEKFDHGSEESFGEFEQKDQAKPKRRNRIKRSLDDVEEEAVPVQNNPNRTLSDQLVDVLAMVILGNDTLPHAEALTDPRELHGEELIRFLDEAIQNTTQYLPDKRSDERREVISIVSPPNNVVKFPYYTRPASEIDMDSALRYAENLTSFSNGLYGSKAAEGVECNEVDVELEDEPEQIEDGGDGAGEGFKPIRRLTGLGDKIDCLKRKHFGSEPLDNPLFREEFVGVPRKMYVPKGTTPAVPQQQQPNPAVAVYNDVIRHIKKHLASQQRRKNSKADTDQADTVMIAVPRVLRLDRSDAQTSGTHLKREARLVFPQANPLPHPLSNHISVPIFDISKYVPRFMMRPNEDLFIDDLPLPTTTTTTEVPRVSNPKVRLHTLVKTAEQLAEGAVAVEESVEKLLTTERSTVRDDIADAFDDVLAKPNQPLAPLPPLKPYSVVEQDIRDSGPEPTFNKSGPPYTALALEPP